MAKPIKTFLYCEFDLIRDGLNALLDNEKSIKFIISKEEIFKAVTYFQEGWAAKPRMKIYGSEFTYKS